MSECIVSLQLIQYPQIIDAESRSCDPNLYDSLNGINLQDDLLVFTSNTAYTHASIPLVLYLSVLLL